MPRTKTFDESEVLDKAIQVFWKQGFNATSIQDLVEHLGINRASMYDTWGDKHQLYMAALKRYRQGSSSWLLEKIRSEVPAKEIIEDFMIHAVEEALNDPERKGCFLVNAATELCNQDPQVNQLFIDNKKTLVLVLSELIKEAQSRGEIRQDKSPEVIASFLYTTVVGLRVISKSENHDRELKEVVRLALNTLS